MDDKLAEAYKTQKKIDKLEEKKAQLKEQIASTPDRHVHIKERLQQQKKEVSKELRQTKKSGYTAIVIAGGLKQGEAKQVADSMVSKAKKIAPDSVVASISGPQDAVGKLFVNNTNKEIEQ